MVKHQYHSAQTPPKSVKGSDDRVSNPGTQHSEMHYHQIKETSHCQAPLKSKLIFLQCAWRFKSWWAPIRVSGCDIDDLAADTLRDQWLYSSHSRTPQLVAIGSQPLAWKQSVRAVSLGSRACAKGFQVVHPQQQQQQKQQQQQQQQQLLRFAHCC